VLCFHVTPQVHLPLERAATTLARERLETRVLAAARRKL